MTRRSPAREGQQNHVQGRHRRLRRRRRQPGSAVRHLVESTPKVKGACASVFCFSPSAGVPPLLTRRLFCLALVIPRRPCTQLIQPPPQNTPTHAIHSPLKTIYTLQAIRAAKQADPSADAREAARQALRRHPLHTLARAARREAPVLYAGLRPAALETAASSAIYFWLYSLLRQSAVRAKQRRLAGKAARAAAGGTRPTLACWRRCWSPRLRVQATSS